MQTKTIFLSLLLLVIFTTAKSQTFNTGSQNFKHNIYLELAGNGLLYTFNYEIQFTKLNDLGLRIGFGGVDKEDYLSMYTFPLMFNYTFGKYENYFETGAGIVYSTNGFYGQGNSGPMKLFPTFCIGFRHQPEDNGFLYRLSWTPVISMEDKTEELIFIPYVFGISLGYTF